MTRRAAPPGPARDVRSDAMHDEPSHPSARALIAFGAVMLVVIVALIGGAALLAT